MGNTIDKGDERDLRWFFSDGQCVFERSNFGAMLEELEIRSMSSEPCGFCIPPDAHEEDAGTGFGPDGDFCRRCLGKGIVPTSRNGKKKKSLTARPKASSRRGQGRQKEPPRDAELTRYAHVSRTLRACSASTVAVLDAYFGLDGERLSDRYGRRGRILAVAAVTRAGRRILGDHDRSLPDAERIAALAERRAADPAADLRGFLAQAMEEARLARDAAFKEWRKATRKNDDVRGRCIQEVA